ncbi:MAG: hypothetical protein KDA89_15110 [Planctomycetaceae bacterium]|nr:hypothetical protein [Planctomycetaceae bacterium]
MSALQQFARDEQFLRLVRRERDVDLVVAALEIARDGQPELTFDPTLRAIRSAVSELTRPIAMAGSEMSELNLLVEYLTERLNLHGDDDCFDCPECSYLNRVVDTGRGIPITLSLIYMAIANELGIPIVGVSAPSHFVVQLETDHGVVYIDAFRGGHIMSSRECVHWLHEITELPTAEIRPTLKPASDRQVIVRMLNNLKSLFGSREDWVSAWKVQQRLALLNPTSYRDKRDLALLTLRAGRPGEAIDLISRCIEVGHVEELPLLQQHLREARRESPRYN